jgi:predicted lipoprotein with Yx(FWY)xxD motif
MFRTKRALASLFALPAIALVAAGCGSSGGSVAAATTTTHSSSTTSAPSATVSAAGNAELGRILVDAQGRTLYLFEKDHGTMSACSGACAAAWPPLRATGKASVGSGLSASKIGTTARSDGKPQVTYNGHPLYQYAADQKPGDTNGQDINGFGGGWYVLSPAGTKIDGAGSSSGNGY